MRFLAVCFKTIPKLECGPMPNVMAALRIYVAPSVENDEKQKFHNSFLVPRCKVWLTPTVRVLCSNAAHRRTQDLDAK